jgi:glycosyltransferase involved in cell wall biosynthesis
MATLPYFVFSPNSVMSLIGLLRGPDRTVPTPAEDWRKATVDVIIPALNEEHAIAACLDSVLRQTMKPRRIMLIDDGSTDRTVAVAEAFCLSQGYPLTVIRRRTPIGKTPTIKRQARELDSDVEFILDGDTVLDSDNYIARTVEELYKAVGIASACGTIMPLRTRDRRRFDSRPALQAFHHIEPTAQLARPKPFLRRVANGITNMYREVLYLFLQRFVYLGQMSAFGSITNPVGCAVAYRRQYVKDLFDKYFPIFGDDLTNSEDIFIGFALLNEGYRNVQLTDVYARTVEPEVQRLPRQLYLWSSSFLQCCYYFDDLLRSAPRGAKSWFARRRSAKPASKVETRPVLVPTVPSAGPTHVRGATMVPGTVTSMPRSAGATALAVVDDPALVPATLPAIDTRTGIERRRIAEPYRQPFGVAHTHRHGRPIGWVLMTSLFEKIAFPTTMIVMIILSWWEALVVTILGETAVSLFALVLVTRGQRIEYFLKGLAIAPMRYCLLLYDAFTIGRFSFDLWISRNRKWRK